MKNRLVKCGDAQVKDHEPTFSFPTFNLGVSYVTYTRNLSFGEKTHCGKECRFVMTANCIQKLRLR